MTTEGEGMPVEATSNLSDRLGGDGTKPMCPDCIHCDGSTGCNSDMKWFWWCKHWMHPGEMGGNGTELCKRCPEFEPIALYDA